MPPLRISYNERIREHLQESAEFRRALLREAVNCLLTGDLDTGKAVLRRYINLTVGFVQLGRDLDRNPKTLMRMFSPKGSPQARNLF
jgi:hypothetical protein